MISITCTTNRSPRMLFILAILFHESSDNVFRYAGSSFENHTYEGKNGVRKFMPKMLPQVGREACETDKSARAKKEFTQKGNSSPLPTDVI